MIKFKRVNQQYNISPITAGFLVLIVSFFLYQIVGGILTVAFVGSEITKENAGSVRLLTVISQILFLLLTSILFAKLIYDDFYNIFRVRKPNINELVIAILGLIVLVGISQVYMYLQTVAIQNFREANPQYKHIYDILDKLDKLIEESYLKIISAENVFDYFSVVLSAALVPAFCEEFLFRGFVQSSFEKKMKPFWAIIVTSIIFGVFHFNPFAILPLIALGAYFSYLAYATGSIFIPIILHFLNNFFTVSIYYFVKSPELIKTQAETNIPITQLYFSLLFFIFLFILTLLILKRQIEKRKQLEKEFEDEGLS